MSEPTNLLISNLLFLMGKHGLNPNSLAERVGNKPPQATIFRILNGESLTPRDSTIAPLAETFGVPLHALRYVDLTKGVSLPASKHHLSNALGTNARSVPVFGLDNTAWPVRLWSKEGVMQIEHEKHAVIATDDEYAFLIPVVDDAMSPRLNIGEYALVEPGTPPELEDDILICLKSGEVLLRRLLSRRSGVRVGTYRSADTQTYAEEQIAWIYTVSNPVPARKIKPRG